MIPMSDGNSETKAHTYSKLMQSRVLSEKDYNLYLKVKHRARDFHKSLLLSVIDFQNPMIDSDYYDPSYSDMLLFGIIPSNEGNNKAWGYIR